MILLVLDRSLLVASIFSFSNDVFRRPLCQGCFIRVQMISISLPYIVTKAPQEGTSAGLFTKCKDFAQ